MCNCCVNHCNIKKITMKNKNFFYGSLCGRYDKKDEQSRNIPNYFELRNKILLSYLNNKKSNKLNIGIPRIFLTLFPLKPPIQQVPRPLSVAARTICSKAMDTSTIKNSIPFLKPLFLDYHKQQ